MWKKNSDYEYFIYCYVPCLMLIYSYSEYFIIATKMILFIVLLFFVIPLSYSTFKKSLTINDISVFKQVEEV